MQDDIRFALSRGPLQPNTLLNFMADLGHAADEFQKVFRDGLDRGWWSFDEDMRCQLINPTMGAEGCSGCNGTGERDGKPCPICPLYDP